MQTPALGFSFVPGWPIAHLGRVSGFGFFRRFGACKASFDMASSRNDEAERMTNFGDREPLLRMLSDWPHWSE